MIFNKQFSDLIELYSKEFKMRIVEVYSASSKTSTVFYVNSFETHEQNDFDTIEGWDITKLLLSGCRDMNLLVSHSQKEPVKLKLYKNNDLCYIEYS